MTHSHSVLCTSDARTSKPEPSRACSIQRTASTLGHTKNLRKSHEKGGRPVFLHIRSARFSNLLASANCLPHLVHEDLFDLSGLRRGPLCRAQNSVSLPPRSTCAAARCRSLAQLCPRRLKGSSTGHPLWGGDIIVGHLDDWFVSCAPAPS